MGIFTRYRVIHVYVRVWEALWEMIILKIFWKSYVKGSGKAQKKYIVIMVLLLMSNHQKSLDWTIRQCHVSTVFSFAQNRIPLPPPVGIYSQLYISAFLFSFLPSDVTLGFFLGCFLGIHHLPTEYSIGNSAD